MVTGAIKESEGFIAKIRALSANDRLEGDERSLLILVLLTRTNEEFIKSTLSEKLFEFCVRLVSTHKKIFFRLVSCLIGFLESKSYRWDEMAEGLLKSAQFRSDISVDEVDTDIFRALLHCALMDDSIRLNSRGLECLWNRIRRDSSVMALDEDQKVIREEDQHWAAVEDIIEKVLLGGGVENNVEFRLEKSLLHLFYMYAPGVCQKSPDPPEFYEKVVLLLSSNNQSFLALSTRDLWHGLIFRCSADLNSSTDSLTFKDPMVGPGIGRLITAHLGSSYSELHQLAWTACAALVTRFRWSWTKLELILSPVSHLCIWVRLAAGEYRIQLENACRDDRNDCAEGIMDACGSVIVSGLHEVVLEADSVEKGNNLSMQADALLHLRQSLLGAFEATLKYVSQADSSSPMNTAGKVLAALFEEFSLWEDLPPGFTSLEALKALKKALSYDVDELWVSLANVFSTAEESTQRINHLRLAELLGNSLAIPIARFWREIAWKRVELIPWVCQATEKWFILVENPDSHALNEIQTTLLEWLQEVAIDRNEESMSILRAVDCFVVLLDERSPTPREKEIVEKVLSTVTISQTDES